MDIHEALSAQDDGMILVPLFEQELNFLYSVLLDVQALSCDRILEPRVLENLLDILIYLYLVSICCLMH